VDTDSRPVRFDTKIAVLLRDDLLPWQRLNVAYVLAVCPDIRPKRTPVSAFLVSGIAAARPEVIGEPYFDADDTRYLPMFGQPVLVFEASKETLTAAHTRALSRGIALTVFTSDLFATGDDVANRAAVRAVPRDQLDLVGLALHSSRNAVDKVIKGARLHP
jgi:hypothetical protein